MAARWPAAPMWPRHRAPAASRGPARECVVRDRSPWSLLVPLRPCHLGEADCAPQGLAPAAAYLTLSRMHKRCPPVSGTLTVWGLNAGTNYANTSPTPVIVAGDGPDAWSNRMSPER